jgi:hypothetical protein
MGGQGSLTLFNTPLSQRFDDLQDLDIQVALAADITPAAKGAFPEGVHELGSKFQFLVQFGQSGVQQAVRRIEVEGIPHIDRALPGKAGTLNIVKVDKLAIAAPDAGRGLMFIFFNFHHFVTFSTFSNLT